jgi:hypothetical protein
MNKKEKITPMFSNKFASLNEDNEDVANGKSVLLFFLINLCSSMIKHRLMR